jgi:uncharacterized repeat protein (TIGR03943 family)
MNSLLNRWLPAVTLLTWAGILIHAHATGRVLALLAPAFRGGVLWAGIGLALVGIVFLCTPQSVACCAGERCGHAFAKAPAGRLLTFLVLLLPISLSAVVSPDQFSKTLVENRGIVTDATQLGRKPVLVAPSEMPLPQEQPAGLPPAQAGGTPPQSGEPQNGVPSVSGSTVPPVAVAPPGGGSDPAGPTDYLQKTADGLIVAEVLDLLYAAQDNAMRKDFEGKRVELVGQLMPDKSKADGAPVAGGKRFKAVRMFMTCCAADARPVATLVEAAALPDLPEMSWIKVVGTSTFPMENGRRISVLKADKVSKTEPPAESMIY